MTDNASNMIKAFKEDRAEAAAVGLFRYPDGDDVPGNKKFNSDN